MSLKKYQVDLSKEEQEHLRSVIAKRNSKSVVVKRAFILLSADRNGDKVWTDKKIAEHYHCTTKTVENIRQRFVLDGFETVLNGKKREVFRAKVFDGEVEAKLLALRCSDAPDGYNKWTLRLLADQMVELKYVESISHEGVRQILKKRVKALAS